MQHRSNHAANPLLRNRGNDADQIPPFAAIKPEHFAPAFERAFADHEAEIAAIAGQSAAPDFANTIAALERAGKRLQRVEQVFGLLVGAHSNEALLEIERELSPRVAQPLESNFDQRRAVPPHRYADAAGRYAAP